MMSSRDRRKELLLSSRRSRSKWVMDASWEDLSTRRELQGSSEGKQASVGSEVPVADSIKTVLDYLSFVSDDGDFLDVQSLTMALPESGITEEEYGEDSDDDEEEEEEGDDDDDDNQKSAKEGKSSGDSYSQISILAEINAATRKPEEECLESKSGNEGEVGAGGTSDTKEERDTAINDNSGSKFDTISASAGIPFVDFLQLLRRQIPEVMALVRSMQTFVAKVGVEAVDANIKFDSERTQEDRHKSWAREIANFILETQTQMRLCSHWADESEESWQLSCTFLEKFVHLKLYPTLFGGDSNTEAQDMAFYQRMQALDFLTPEHLDIKSLKLQSSFDGGGGEDREVNDWGALFNVPISRFRDLEECRTPMDMIACLKTVTVGIAASLRAALGDDGGDPGADELLPMMILTLVRVKPKKMHSVLAYMNNYTSEHKMDSETGYLITQLMSAVQFLSELDASRITIASHDFEEKMLRCQEQAKAQTSARFYPKKDKFRDSSERGSGGSEKGNRAKEKQSGTRSLSLFSSQIEEDAFVSSLLECAQDDTAILSVMSRFSKKVKKGSNAE